MAGKLDDGILNLDTGQLETRLAGKAERRDTRTAKVPAATRVHAHVQAEVECGGESAATVRVRARKSCSTAIRHNGPGGQAQDFHNLFKTSSGASACVEARVCKFIQDA